jgi:glycine cleavage system aminomethyltransferase T
LEADVTVCKFAADKFMVVATDTAHRHVETLLRRRVEDDSAHAFVTDVTGAIAFINIQGPLSRKLMVSAQSPFSLLFCSQKTCMRD